MENSTAAPESVAIGPEAIATSYVALLLKKQYQATLMMLREAIEKCPDELWARASDTNQSWQLAYHALYFTHLYLQPGLDEFKPWPGQHAPSQNDDGIGGPPDPKSNLPVIPEPYTKEEVLAFWQYCWDGIESAIAELDLTSEKSGFPWYPFSKLEHQLVNLRHAQHHTAQLAERLRTSCGEGIRWYGTWPRSKRTQQEE